ncbi:MAG: HTH domain-containing protein [Sporomusaceae bacterium]|nr:HTH domain-containing protein [Sporomusaceae bacterium]
MKKGRHQPKKREPDEDKKRQQAILKIIQEQKVRTQKELSEIIGVSQATISRDVKELEISPLDGYYQPKEAHQLSSVQQGLKDLIQEKVIFASDDIRLLGLHVEYGFCEPIARFIDTAYCEKIFGTITGPQSVIVIAPNTGEGNKVLEDIYKMIPPEQIKKAPQSPTEIE